MEKPKRTNAVSLKLSDKMKVAINEEALKNVREINQEIVILLAEAIAHRKCRPTDYL